MICRSSVVVVHSQCDAYACCMARAAPAAWSTLMRGHPLCITWRMLLHSTRQELHATSTRMTCVGQSVRVWQCYEDYMKNL